MQLSYLRHRNEMEPVDEGVVRRTCIDEMDTGGLSVTIDGEVYGYGDKAAVNAIRHVKVMLLRAFNEACAFEAAETLDYEKIMEEKEARAKEEQKDLDENGRCWEEEQDDYDD